MGERHILILLGGYHGLIWLGRMLRSERLLGAGYLLGRDHATQQDLL
jgi:hypothetical protein